MIYELHVVRSMQRRGIGKCLMLVGRFWERRPHDPLILSASGAQRQALENIAVAHGIRRIALTALKANSAMAFYKGVLGYTTDVTSVPGSPYEVLSKGLIPTSVLYHE